MATSLGRGMKEEWGGYYASPVTERKESLVTEYMESISNAVAVSSSS